MVIVKVTGNFKLYLHMCTATFSRKFLWFQVITLESRDNLS